jgi:hypothetical protein
MSATQTPVRVTSVLGIDLEDVLRGLHEATSGIEAPELSGLLDAAGVAFDREVLDAAAYEIRHDVAQLLVGAVKRRMPWEWPDAKHQP